MAASAWISKKMSAVSSWGANPRRARSVHDSSYFSVPSGTFNSLLGISAVGIVALGYKAIQPPQSKIPGTPNGPSVTAPRIKLRDGRHLAYFEFGVPKSMAKHKVIHVHGFDCCKYDAIPKTPSNQKLHEELGIYSVSFDRPGYGESDPDTKRTPESIALDIEQLADQLELGPKFHVIGYSMGGEIIWSCLKYIPHRLAGAALLAPVGNYWWPGFPASVSRKAYSQQLKRDQWAVRVAHYAPWLMNWWNTQKLFPSSSVKAKHPDGLSPPDKEILGKLMQMGPRSYEGIIRQQGEHESLHRDMIVGFGTWEFDPMDLENPFPKGEGSVHLWHGHQDYIVPVALPRYIAQRLPWIKYHELPNAGHMFPFAAGMHEHILKVVLLGETSA